MREILFRGKRTDNGEWVKGFYCMFNGKKHLIYTGYAEVDCGDYYPDAFEVDPFTVGQYTGLTDKYGVKIFDGDIIYRPSEEITPYYLVKSERYKIIFRNGSFAYTDLSGDTYWSIDDCDFGIGTEDYTIIGNVYDNPELLKESEQT